MESLNKRVILIAIIMAFFTTFLIYVYIKKATTRADTVDYINVYVAAKTLPVKTMISENDIKQIKIMKEYLNPKAILNKADIVGKRIKESIIEGEQILTDRLVDENSTTLAFSLPEGKRAVSINVSEQIEVANLLRPGDYVDVLASFQRSEEENRNKNVYLETTKTVLQDIQVIAIGQDMVYEEGVKKEQPKTVTLAVTPQDAEKLVFTSEFAILRLALRPVDDHTMVSAPGIVKNDVLPGKGVLVLP